MTEVAFHFNARDRAAHACRVARKLLRQDRRLVIQAPEPLLTTIDEMLWNMSAHDFVAHCSAGDPLALWDASPVLLTNDAIATPHQDVLLNLHEQVPANFGSFQELIEVVSADDITDREAARLRWKHYRERGYTLVRHDLVNREI